VNGEVVEEDSERFGKLLGTAVVELWSSLPQEVQQALFDAAATAGSQQLPPDIVREQLAIFLHERHPRTGLKENDAPD
jgi:hypothetical protein